MLARTQFSPVGTPTVAHNPVLLVHVLIIAPSHNTHTMMVLIRSIHGRIPHDAARVVLEKGGIHRCLDGSTNINFGHNSKGIVLIRAILSDGGIGKARDGLTTDSVHARAANVEIRARRVDMRTHAFFTIGRACNVRLACVKRNVPDLMNKLKGLGGAAPLATAGRVRSASEEELDRKIDLGISSCTTSYINAISKAAGRRMSLLMKIRSEESLGRR